MDTVFVVHEFSGDEYDKLFKNECRILGYPALFTLASKKYPIPDLERPLFSLAMDNVVTCFTGFRNRDEVVNKLHYFQNINNFLSIYFFFRIC